MISRKMFVVCPLCHTEVSVNSLNDKTAERFGREITPFDPNDDNCADCSYACPHCGGEIDGIELNAVGRYLWYPGNESSK